ncbi:ankyrin repeat domain-containing protein [bacterium]|nr:ankyrin repeat domain-containing protein [bacterium]
MYPEYQKDLELLEIEEGASLSELKTAYRTLTKVWHPDRFSHDEELRKKADEKLAKINLAYKRLTKYFKSRNTSKKKPNASGANSREKGKSGTKKTASNQRSTKQNKSGAKGTKRKSSPSNTKPVSKLNRNHIRAIQVCAILLGMILMRFFISLFSEDSDHLSARGLSSRDLQSQALVAKSKTFNHAAGYVSDINGDSPNIHLKGRQPISISSAVDGGNVDAVKLYLESGGSPKRLHYAFKNQRGRNKDINEYQISIFSAAITTGNTELIKLFIEHGVDIDEIDNEMTPLKRAVIYRHPNIVKFLIDSGCEYNASIGGKLIHEVLAYCQKNFYSPPFFPLLRILVMH